MQTWSWLGEERGRKKEARRVKGKGKEEKRKGRRTRGKCDIVAGLVAQLVRAYG